MAVDVVTIILTAICTGIGVSIGQAFYEFVLKERLHKVFDKTSKIKEPIIDTIKSSIQKTREGLKEDLERLDSIDKKL